MTIIPKKGYRVCLDCGKIFLSKQLLSGETFGVKSDKVCPFCYGFERVKSKRPILNDQNAIDLFRIAEMKCKEFCLSDDIIAKYERMYDNCLVPKKVRV